MELMRNKEFDNKLKAKLGDLAPPVPPDLWNKIEIQLEASEPTKMKQLEKYRVSFLLYGAIAATFLIAFAFWKFWDTEMIHLRKNPETLVSKVPIEERYLKNDEKRVNQHESLLKIDYRTNEKTQKEAEKKVVSIPPRIKNVRSIAKNTTQIDADYIVQFVEPVSSFTLSPSKTPLDREEILSENMPIVLKETILIQEESQNTPVEEIGKSKNKRLGVSKILNFLAKGLNNGDENLIEFSESEEGILKLDLKSGLAKSKD